MLVFEANTNPLDRGHCCLCKCEAIGRLYGFRVCGYHAEHGEDDEPCPNCKDQKDQQ